jgi:hypothetical protein
LAHDVIAIVGVLIFLQAPITSYLANFNISSKAMALGFGGIGLLATLLSKLIDSRSYTNIQTAHLAALAADSTSHPPVDAPTAP